MIRIDQSIDTTSKVKMAARNEQKSGPKDSKNTECTYSKSQQR